VLQDQNKIQSQILVSLVYFRQDEVREQEFSSAFAHLRQLQQHMRTSEVKLNQAKDVRW